MATQHVRRRRSSGLPLLLIVLVGVLGVIGGLVYAWFVDPVEYVNVEPSQMGEEEQRTYLILVSLAFASDGDLARARLRLGALGLHQNAGEALADAADEAVTLGLADRSVRALTNLALAFGGQPGAPALAFAGPLPPPPTFPAPPAVVSPFIPPPTLTSTPTPEILTATPPIEGTITLTPTPRRDRFALVDLVSTCDEDEAPGLMVVFVQDAGGDGLPGVEVQVQWEGGQDTFFTGLKPERDPGYADFSMTEDEIYRVRIVEKGNPASQLSTEIEAGLCALSPEADPRVEGYQLVFRERG